MKTRVEQGWRRENIALPPALRPLLSSVNNSKNKKMNGYKLHPLRILEKARIAYCRTKMKKVKQYWAG